MRRALILLSCLAATGCVAVDLGPTPPGSTELSQQTIHGAPPSVWTCYLNREPACQ